MREVTLSSISEMKYGKMPPKDIVIETGGEFPIYSGYRITGYAKEFLYKNEMLIVVARGVGGTGDVKISPPEAWITNLSIVLTIDEEQVDKYYLKYLLNREKLKDKLNTGAAQAQITIDSLSGYKIKLPDIDIQKRVKEIILGYERLIENNRRRIQLLEESARLLYKEWFVHLRFPGHEHVKITDGVPEGWDKKFLSEAIDVNPKTPVEKGEEIKYVPMSSLSESGMTANESNFEIRSKHTSVKFKQNDVLLARITPCLENGKTGFVYFLDGSEVACGSTEFIILRGKDVSPAFTYCLARSYPLREKAIKSMIGSSGRQRVQVSCFDKFIVPVPPGFLIQQFDEVVNDLFSQIKVLMQANKRLIEARGILLPRLMNGELVV